MLQNNEEARFNYVKSLNEFHRIPERLWINYETMTDLAYEIRSGYRITDVYKDIETGYDISPLMLAHDVKNDTSIPDSERDEIRKHKIILRHPESVLDHSGRVANTMSEIMLAYPKLFTDYNQMMVLKAALNHDVGEATVHDVADDGSKAHDLKAEEELKAVDAFYKNSLFYLSDSLLFSYHQQFENVNTFLGQMLKMVDKTDAIARLILFEKYEIYGNIYDKTPPSEQDIKFAEEIGTGNCTDVWARHLYWLFHEEYKFEPAIIKIAEDFLFEGTVVANRPWFTFWPRI